MAEVVVIYFQIELNSNECFLWWQPSNPRTLPIKQKWKIDYVVLHILPLLKAYRVRGFIYSNSDYNLDCGLSPNGAQCGSEQWLFSNATLLPFVKGTCQNGNAFSTYSNEVCLCPPAADLGTCTCALSTGSTTTVTINCAGQKLGNSAVATLVDKISWAPIDTLILDGNLLTQVPANLAQLANVTTLSLASNGFTSIGSGELNLKATVVSLDVSNNSISTIAANALPGDDRF